MRILNVSLAVAFIWTVSTVANIAHAREQIQIVGSSTVFPFSALVAERFGRTTDFKTPVVESTGSGGGIKLFCAGIGLKHPDIANASRRIKQSERETCDAAGVTFQEVRIGYDGVVLANARTTEQFSLTRKQIYLALAAQVPDENGALIPNPHQLWSDIDLSLPDIKIEVLGPPPTSGTRDVFAELIMRPGALEFEVLSDLQAKDDEAFRIVSDTMREDGRFIEGGENDNLLVQKISSNPAALAIFGFSFLEENRDKVQGSQIGNIAPTFETIASGEYPLSRPLFFYVKKEHIGTVPGIEEFVTEFISDKAIGPEGYAIDKGLIPLADAEGVARHSF